MREKDIQVLLKQQLDQLLTTLSFIPEAKQAGNAAYYLERLANYVSNLGTDEPMVVSLWLQEDLAEIAKQSVERNTARQVFARIDHTHDANIGVNWEVLGCALEQN